MNTAASKGIILAGATNYIERVNHEITGNPRRMGTIIHCGNPDLDDRIDILKKLLTGLPIITEDFMKEDIEAKKILEINESHKIVEKLEDLYNTDKEALKKYSKILFAQACLIEGLPIDNPTELTNLICEQLSE